MNDPKTPEDFGAIIGKTFGNMLVACIWQNRAIIELSNSLRSDPNVSQETRDKAESALVYVKRTIEKLEEVMGDDGAQMMSHFFEEAKDGES